MLATLDVRGTLPQRVRLTEGLGHMVPSIFVLREVGWHQGAMCIAVPSQRREPVGQRWTLPTIAAIRFRVAVVSVRELIEPRDQQ